MRAERRRTSSRKSVAALLPAGAALMLLASSAHPQDDGTFHLRLTSHSFQNGHTLPLSMIDNAEENGVNRCTPNGSAGGNESPELAWEGVPWGTQSFIVVVYDTTASFTHWGLYNIAARARGVPANAGILNSSYGDQITNDFGDAHYDGPCPPANVAPDVHRYQFTVYALDTTIHLSGSANFPAGAETLYHALIKAGREGHILGSASLLGLYSATPP
jgi:Raf kinase inhibitor-like YbhB/YbcL family protein